MLLKIYQNLVGFPGSLISSPHHSENEKGRIYTQLPFGEELRGWNQISLCFFFCSAFKYGDFSRKLFQKRIKTVKLVEFIDEDDIR